MKMTFNDFEDKSAFNLTVFEDLNIAGESFLVIPAPYCHSLTHSLSPRNNN
jgi:hypothetical protein